MKSLIYALALLLSTVTIAATPSVDEQINKQFEETFPSANNPKWYDYESFYEVIFNNNDIMCRVKYDLKGNIISAMRYYTEKNLSLFVVAKVKEKYPGKKIFGITEVTSVEGVTYHIILEDEKNWFNLTSSDSGDLTLDKKYKKA